MDNVYIRYFGQVIKFKQKDYDMFIDHLVKFRHMEDVEDKYPRDTMSWLMGEFGIEELDLVWDGPTISFLDHRRDDKLVTLSVDEFERLRNDRIKELSKYQRKKFEQESSLADDHDPMLKYLDLDFLAACCSERIIELKLPCNDDLDNDLQDMKNLGFRGDRHSEKMARRIQFWRTYALSMALVDREVKQQQNLNKRESIFNGMKGGKPIQKPITAEILDTAIRLAIKNIKLPSSKNTFLNRTAVFNSVASEVQILTDKKASSLGNWMNNNGISRDYIYGKMPDHIKDRMRK